MMDAESKRLITEMLECIKLQQKAMVKIAQYLDGKKLDRVSNEPIRNEAFEIRELNASSDINALQSTLKTKIANIEKMLNLEPDL